LFVAVPPHALSAAQSLLAVLPKANRFINGPASLFINRCESVFMNGTVIHLRHSQKHKAQ
jgi:hypothetical protein